MKMHLTPMQTGFSRLGVSPRLLGGIREYSFHAPGVALHSLNLPRDIDYLKEGRSLIVPYLGHLTLTRLTSEDLPRGNRRR